MRDPASSCPDDKPVVRLGFLVIEGYSSLCVSALINPLRSANRELGYQAYVWDILTLDDQPVAASDGIMVAAATLPLRTTQQFDYFFVSAAANTDPGSRSTINAALHRFSRQSGIFGGLCTGAFLLARAGFLRDKRFTLHWENQPAFAEEFPELEISPNLYVMDGRLWTGSGGLSSMDMALGIIASDHGYGVANAVGNQYQIDRMRAETIGQRPFSLDELDTLPDPLQRAVSAMMEHMETPLTVPEVADHAGKTVRSLERAFARHLETSPAKFYRKIRLDKARHLLWHTNLPILNIALMTGFPSPSHLSRLYRLQFGIKPSAERGPEQRRFQR